jgi:hypothetical protein
MEERAWQRPDDRSWVISFVRWVWSPVVQLVAGALRCPGLRVRGADTSRRPSLW